MSRRQCTRRLEFDAAHRVTRHESKCRNLHGHRYAAEVTASAPRLDDLDRVVDFGVLKSVVGAWLDEAWDHATICNEDDHALVEVCRANDWRFDTVPGEPTAELLAEVLAKHAQLLLDAAGAGVLVTHVRLYETPNCWADYSTGGADE